ncbi:MAG TPA: hypothetical protein PL189_06185 [bacterium]|nr:hypothetical protein [bacterium]
MKKVVKTGFSDKKRLLSRKKALYYVPFCAAKTSAEGVRRKKIEKVTEKA